MCRRFWLFSFYSFYNVQKLYLLRKCLAIIWYEVAVGTVAKMAFISFFSSSSSILIHCCSLAAAANVQSELGKSTNTEQHPNYLSRLTFNTILNKDGKCSIYWIDWWRNKRALVIITFYLDAEAPKFLIEYDTFVELSREKERKNYQ